MVIYLFSFCFYYPLPFPEYSPTFPLIYIQGHFVLITKKIILKNNGEYFGAIHDFEYNIGDKLYEFAIMSHQEFEKLKAIYTQLIELVCYAKETDSEEEKLDCFFKMFQLVRTCLEFSPYTHFYTQILIDIIAKTYNTKTFRSDLLFKSQIDVFALHTPLCLKIHLFLLLVSININLNLKSV